MAISVHGTHCPALHLLTQASLACLHHPPLQLKLPITALSLVDAATENKPQQGACV